MLEEDGIKLEELVTVRARSIEKEKLFIQVSKTTPILFVDEDEPTYFDFEVCQRFKN